MGSVKSAGSESKKESVHSCKFEIMGSLDHSISVTRCLSDSRGILIPMLDFPLA